VLKPDFVPVKPPAKVMDPIYNTPEFQAWRAQVLERAGQRCEALDDYGHRCTKAQPQHRVYADHIVMRLQQDLIDTRKRETEAEAKLREAKAKLFELERADAEVIDQQWPAASNCNLH
jgi:hypothetical protein